MGASLSLTAYEVENSVNVANNTSQVYIKLDITTNNGTWSHDYTTAGSITLDGKQIVDLDGKWVDINTTTNLYKGTHTVTHNADGTKTVAISAAFDMNTATRWIYASKNVTLTTIARKSTLSVGNGTLGTPLSFTITELAAAHTHKIKYFCGDVEGYILGTANATSAALTASWTPPESLAAQNTGGKSLSVEYVVYTFNENGALVGSNSYSRTLSIPSSVKPSCSVSVSDAMNYAETYGGYIQGLSKFKITVTPELAYGSPIAAYSVNANGEKYAANNVTTGPIASAQATQTISATVTDARGWPSDAATVTVPVLPYNVPTVSALTVRRCNSNGAANEEGEYVQVTFAGTISSLGGKNAATYKLKYKKSSDASYTTVNNAASPYIFAAETGSSYDVVVEVTDNFNTSSKSTSASTAFTLLHFREDGTGMGVGKVAETANALDMGLPILMNGIRIVGVGAPIDDTDAATKGYAVSAAAAAVAGLGLAAYTGGGNNGIDPDNTLEALILTSHTNAPQGLGTFYFIHTSFYNTKSATAARAQFAYPYSKLGSMYHRVFTSGAWSAWERYMSADEIMPVGSIVMRYDTTSPATIYGGTWVRIEGRMLFGCAESGTVGATGTHTTGSGSSSLPYVNVAIWRRTA